MGLSCDKCSKGMIELYGGIVHDLKVFMNQINT